MLEFDLFANPMPASFICFVFWPSITFHSKKPSTGTTQRRSRYALGPIVVHTGIAHIYFAQLHSSINNALSC